MYLKKGYMLSNRYEIIEKIGAGGMSIVYKAYCTHLKRTVAIKVLREEYVEDEEFINKFMNEATSVANLSHPNIVNIFDVGNDGDIYFIVMEYLDGKDLENIIHKVGKIDSNAALTILYSIGEALSYAHKNNVIHRDLKSKNIIINDDGVVKVADFGIATATTTSTLTVAINAIGSVHYFSPEQAKGEQVDQRSDIYSLGIIGYELFTGELPFNGDTPVQVALKHVTDELPRPSELCGCSLSVDYLIMKACSKDMLDRYQTMDDMLKDINDILDGKEIYLDHVKDGIIKKDEVDNFSKILDEEKEEKEIEERQEQFEKQSIITKNNLDKLDEVNNKIDNEIEEDKPFKTLSDFDFDNKKKSSKINNLLKKFGIYNEDEDEEINEGEAYHVVVDEKPESRIRNYVSLTELDDNKELFDDSKAREEELESKAQLAASKFFDAYDNNENVTDSKNKKKTIKKKFNILDFITVEVEDDLTEEEYKLQKEKRKQKKTNKNNNELLEDGKDDEMSDGYISKDDDKKVVRAAVITSLVIIAFILWGMIKYIIYLNDNRLIEVPDFKGKTYEQIKDEWKEKGINLEVTDEVVNDNYEQGVIVSQNIESGRKISRHSMVEVVLSKGKISAIMPDLQARSLEEAVSALERYQVHITTSSLPNEEIPEGYIVSTSPSYGTPIEDGMNIVLYISEGGATMYIMPDLIGLTEEEAKVKMEDVGLKLGNVTYKTDNKDNAVITRQSESVGTPMMMGGKANVELDESISKISKDKDKDKNKNDNTTENETSSNNDENKKEPVMDTATITIESKVSGVLDDDRDYIVEIDVEQPTLGSKTVYANKVKGKDINTKFKKQFNLELGSDISVIIDGVVQKTVHFE